ncbi:MAG: hypothetical protein HZB26_10305 [Candidatus Hydrogenedentes bacterium]|nr:hypothetical protein [Candidatus Hydrogenedentota bacterium]
MSTLTKRERVMRTVHYDDTDRVPLYDIIQNDAIVEHYAGRPLTVADGDHTVALAVGRTLDMTRMVTGPAAPGEYTRADGLRIQQERWTSWITHRPFQDVDQLVGWVKERIREANASEFAPAQADDMRAHIQKRWAQFAEGDPTGRGDPTVFVIESGVGLTEMYWAAGMDLFTELMMEHPDLVEEWLEARLQSELRRVARIADPCFIPIALTYDDIAFKNGPIFSPDWLRRYWVPRLARLVDAWHARDVYCLFHSDGNLWLILDDLVAAGIDGLNPLEVMAGMTVGAVRKKYPELFLTGGIDVSQLLTYGSPDEVTAACLQAMTDASGLGYFMGSTTELHWDVPLANAVAMFETAWHEGP